MSLSLRDALPAALALVAIVLGGLAIRLHRRQRWHRERRVTLRDNLLITGPLKPVKLTEILRADWSAGQALLLKDRAGRTLARILSDTPNFLGVVTRVFDALRDGFIPITWPARIAAKDRGGPVLVIGDRYVEKIGPGEQEERWLLTAVKDIVLMIGERHYTPTQGLVRTPSLDIALALRDGSRAVLTQQSFPLLETWGALRRVFPLRG